MYTLCTARVVYTTGRNFCSYDYERFMLIVKQKIAERLHCDNNSILHTIRYNVNWNVVDEFKEDVITLGALL